MNNANKNHQNNEIKTNALREYQKAKPKTFDFIECVQMNDLPLMECVIK